MKALIFTSLLMTSTGFAQTLDVTQFKKLMTDRQFLLETVAPGMSKKIVTTGNFTTEAGADCSYTSTATQTLLKIQGDKIVILSKERFVPTNSPECTNANITAYDEKILFYDPKPLLTFDLEAIDAAAENLASLSKAGNVVTMKLNLSEEQEDGTIVTDVVTVQYDLSKPSFKNLILNAGTGYSTATSDLADIDPMTMDLTDVLFCENNDGDNSECVQGDYSDILY